MIDWTLIKNKFPKAFEKFQGDKDNSYWDVVVTSKGNSYLTIFSGEMQDYKEGMYTHFYERSLYDFFDEEGIFIAITRDNAFGNEVHNGLGDIFYENKDWFPERIEAEEEAFTKAFELLEEKLTKI